MLLSPVHADIARLERITVCTRPFRALGPRIEAERLGRKLLVHNYGHGGSGWSLSWGSAALVAPLVLATGARRVGVIGCGALGLTAAVSLQRAGVHVTIYAQDLPPDVRSSRATGSWTPDARVALARDVDSSFARRWEGMARVSFAEYAHSLQLAGEPIKAQPRYVLSEVEPDAALAERFRNDPLGFVHLESLLADLTPPPLDLPPGTHPFSGLYCRQLTAFRFDLTAYARHLVEVFLAGGGTLRRAVFAGANELTALKEDVLVNCTGYGAAALFRDRSLTPVRGQIAWLPAQPEVDYSLQWKTLNVVSRPDGMVVQLGGGGDVAGWNDPGEMPDVHEAERAIHTLAELQGRQQARR